MRTQLQTRVVPPALALALFASLQANTDSAYAQEYPSRPIRFVVPYAPGGSTDILARLIGQRLSEMWGQQIIVDNRPGAGGNIGSNIVAQSPPDGYALVMATNGSHAINASFYTSMPHDVVKDFTPVILVAQVPVLLVVNNTLPVKTVRDLITLAHARPGQLSFGSGSAGGTGHLAGEMFNTLAQVKIVHVPYKGDAPGIADVIGGQIAMHFSNMPAAVQYVKAGRVRALAVTTPQRSSALPDVPTIAQAGIAGFEVIPWYGVMGPARLPQPVLDKLNGAINAILKEPQIKDRLIALGADPIGGPPSLFVAQILADVRKYAQAVKASGTKAD
ncbi:MAG: tripartite tricarboxylate transporter substrate binding protein [Betaproteobacteria bacterium]|nr:tripartite tricarboxylate transporter substrate binding protein [Betaproteobacteria bacterium]